ncbi:MAG: hypothetical protein ACLP7F_22135 [Acidimicrobiales bacterium]
MGLLGRSPELVLGAGSAAPVVRGWEEDRGPRGRSVPATAMVVPAVNPVVWGGASFTELVRIFLVLSMGPLGGGTFIVLLARLSSVRAR